MATNDMQAAHDELYVYTMGRPNFILQHVTDAYMAQTMSETSKPIGMVFSLAGLFLHVEKGWTGAQVQQAHRQLAERRCEWPRVALPAHRGGVTALDVMAAPAGPERDAAIDRWCESVWGAFSPENREMVVALLAECGVG